MNEQISEWLIGKNSDIKQTISSVMTEYVKDIDEKLNAYDNEEKNVKFEIKRYRIIKVY